MGIVVTKFRNVPETISLASYWGLTFNANDFATYFPYNGATSIGSLFSSNSTYRSAREVQTSRWREILRNGGDACTDVAFESTVRKRDGRRLFVLANIANYSGPGQDFNGWFLANMVDILLRADVPNRDLSMLTERATEKFRKVAQSKLTAFGGATFLGELRQTIQLITKPGQELAKRIARHRKQVKSQLGSIRGGYWSDGNWYGSAESAKNARRLIGNMWLGFQFGVRPVINDIDNGARALADYYFDKTPYENITTSFKDRLKQVVDFNNGVFIFAWIERSEVLSEGKVTIRGRIKLSEDGSLKPAVNNYFGLNWRQAVLAGWELVPHSFLVEYFSNIGDMLRAAMFPYSAIAWANVTERLSKKQTCEVLPGTFSCPGFPGSKITADCDLSNKIEYRIVERRKNFILGLPPLRLKVPGIGSLKWVNIAALLSQRV